MGGFTYQAGKIVEDCISIMEIYRFSGNLSVYTIVTEVIHVHLILGVMT